MNDNYPQNPGFPPQQQPTQGYAPPQQYAPPAMGANAPLPEASIGFGNSITRAPRWDKDVPWYDLANDMQWHSFRFVGPVFMVSQHWFQTRTGKKFTHFCLDFDYETGQRKQPTNCPACTDFPATDLSPDPIKGLRPRLTAFVHALVRDIQMTGGNPSDPTWTAIRPMRLPISVVQQVRSFKSANKVNINGKVYEADVTDPYYGRDVAIMYNKSNANNKYQCIPQNQSPLTQQEQVWAQRLYDWKNTLKLPEATEIKSSLVQNGYYQLINAGGMPVASAPGTQNAGNMVLPSAPQPPAGFGMVASVGGTPPPPAYAPPMPSAPPAYAQPQTYAPPPPAYAPPAPAYAPPPPAYAPQPAPAPAYAQPAPQAPASAPAYAPPPPGLPGAPPTGSASPFPVGGGASPQPFPLPTTGGLTPPGFQMPQVAAPVAPAAPMAPTRPAAVPGERRFQVAGAEEPVNVGQYQEIITTYSQTDAARLSPLKAVADGDLSGICAPKCYGGYKGDNTCLRCPVRRYCLQV